MLNNKKYKIPTQYYVYSFKRNAKARNLYSVLTFKIEEVSCIEYLKFGNKFC